MLSTPRRLGLSSIVLFGIGISSLAHAANIPPQELEDNRKTCMSSCLEQTGNAAGCTAFCTCTVEGLAKEVTNEEYEAGKNAVAAQQKPAAATIEKLTAISQSCRSNLDH